MYTVKRTYTYFCGELNKFIQVAENHARNEKTQLMRCPCFDCQNLRVFSNPTTIRLHMIVRGFVKDYMVWKQHGETDAPPPPANNPLSQIVEDDDFDRMVSSYFHDGRDDDGVSGSHGDDGDADDVGVSGSHGDDVVCPMDSDSSDDELDDGDFLGQLLRHTKAEVLIASVRGLANFETVKKSARELIYDRSKGCRKHWTVLRFILELLTLKAKHSWSDGSFNDLLPILA